MQKRLAAIVSTLLFGSISPVQALSGPGLGVPTYAIGITTGGTVPNDPCSTSLSASLGLSGACASGASDSTASGVASAGKGVVKAISTVDASSSLTGGSRGGSATANASFSEQLAIIGLPNASGHLTGLVVVDGSVGTSVSGSSLSATSASATFQLTGSFFNQNFSQQANSGIGTNGYDEHSALLHGTPIPIDVSFTFDSTGMAVGSFTLNLQTQVSGLAAGYQETSVSPYIGGHTAATSAFGHTVYWGGIASLQINGTTTTAYSVVSASGLDYRFAAAVPEPGLLPLLLLGLGVLGLKMRPTPSRSARR